MTRLTVVFMAAALALSAAAAAVEPAAEAKAAETWTPETFGALPTYSDVEISPDGKRLALLQADGEAVVLVVREIDGGDRPARGTRIEGAAARGLYWAGDGHVLVLVSQTLQRNTNRGMQLLYASRWLSFPVDTLKARVLFDDETGYYILSPGTLMAAPVDGTRAVFARWTLRGSARADAPIGTRLTDRRSAGGIGLLLADLDTGEDELLAPGTGATVRWQVGADGKPLLRADEADGTDDALGSVWVVHGDGDEPRRLDLRSEIDGVSRIAAAGRSSVDGAQLVSGRRDGLLGVWRYDTAKGELGELVFQPEAHDIDSFVYDHRIAAMRGVRWIDDLPRVHWFDRADRAVQRGLEAALPGAAPVVSSRSADGNRLVVRVEYVDHPAQWFLFQRDGGRLDMIAPTYAGLDGKTLPKREKYDYVAEDGWKIPGYLTVPVGEHSGPRPLIVLPHGGPNARDDQRFDWWAGFYAARGYLVYQPNFRGSDGYGLKFLEAGDGEWGKGMQRDIDTGVRKLIADGRAAAGRVCIVGASYGGYAALAGATLSGDLYACAVSVNGIANIGDLFDVRDPESNAYWETRVGDRHDREALRAVSPFHQAKDANAPVLLIHAKDDVVVRIGQSRMMARALKAHGKDVELVELDGEDHWLSGAATRTEMLRRSIAFLDRHLGAGSEETAE
jgi:dipeptidyl aminopeptidase/acylaminoacyl peptidase